MTEPVECYSGSAYAEKPVALHWEGDRLEIEEIEARWRAPGGRVFVVRVRDGRRFELVYDEVNDHWQIKQEDRQNQ